MKKYLLLIAVLAIFMTSCQPKTIGGQKDEYGCLTSAGYSWDEGIGACTRIWELDESQVKAAEIAVAPISARPVTIISVETLRCPGCFIVNMQTGDGEPYAINIVDWEISSGEITSFEECVAAGNPVMESYPRQCSAGDNTFTEVLEHICTEEEKKAEICTMEYMPVCGDNGITYGNKCSACASKEIDSYIEGACKLSLDDAFKIAESCEGTAFKEGAFYNSGTRTWWFSTDLEKEGCSPACVVDETTLSAEINWRCTGLIVE